MKSKKLNLLLLLFFKTEPIDYYVNFLKQKRCLQQTKKNIVHKHHIIPKYWFKENSKYEKWVDFKFNLVYLNLKDHITAHRILYEILKDPRDKGAFLLLQNQTRLAIAEYRKAGALAVHDLLKASKKNFWNSEEQKKNAAKSLLNPQAHNIRSKGGKKGGYQRNINRVINKKSKVLFLLNDHPFLCVFNCQTGGDVLYLLHQAHLTKLQPVTPLLKGDRKKLHGWSCVWIIK